jgi:hypothetical protein
MRLNAVNSVFRDPCRVRLCGQDSGGNELNLCGHSVGPFSYGRFGMIQGGWEASERKGAESILIKTALTSAAAQTVKEQDLDCGREDSSCNSGLRSRRSGLSMCLRCSSAA